MKKIHILESTLRYLLDEGRNAEKAKQKTIAVMKNYLSQNGIQGEQLDAMAMEYENSLKEWLFHANMPDSIIRLEPIMANVAMQLGFTPKNRDTRELYRLKNIMNYITANYQKEDFPIALNKLTLDNTSFDSLNELFGSAMDVSKGSWKPSNDGKPKPHYTVKRLDTFEEAYKYFPYTQDICYLRKKDSWNTYTEYGKNAVYMLLRDGWENIPAKHGEDTPYDEYGESMVFVIIRPDSGVAYTNTRWNHNTNGKGPVDVDQSFTENMKKVSDMLQTDYRNVLKPYTDEELVERGEITLPMLCRWISEGKDILNLCKDTEELTDDLVIIHLTNTCFVLYNTNTNQLVPSDNIRLRNVTYDVEYPSIQREDGKWSFINPDGEQICGWYEEVYDFSDGFAAIKREDGEWTFINTKGQQICDWYKFACEFRDGFACVQRDDGKYTFINTQGHEIFGEYKHAWPFVKGFARVQRDDGKWTLINTYGEPICDWYKDVDDFAAYGVARVQRDDGKWTLINTYGEPICDWYKKIVFYYYGVAKVWRSDDAVSLINKDGKQICDWYHPNTEFRIISPNKIYDINNNLIPLYNESHTRLNDLITEVLHTSIRKHLLHN